MAYLSLYRKYRSQTFGDLVGQDHIVKTLENSLKLGRIAHAYLFTGPRGTGKTSTARMLAKAVNCENGPTHEPCNTCYACQSITEGSSMDVVEIDAASESRVEDVREKIVQFADYSPATCRYRIFIIDEVHDLSAKAFDALLKTIEEPPAHLIFILATTEYASVPPTIRSRCQKFEFHRGSIQDVGKCLQAVATAEGIAVEPAALNIISRMADGGYRDALTLLEQVAVTAEGPITAAHVYDQLGLLSDESVDAIIVSLAQRDPQVVLHKFFEVIRLGRDPRGIVESLLIRLAELTHAHYGLETGSDGAANAAAHEVALQIGAERLSRLRDELARIHREIRAITIPRVWLEAELLRLCQEAPSPIAGEPKPVPKQPEIERQPEPAPSVEPRPEAQETPVPSAVVKTQSAANGSGGRAPQELTGDPDLDAAIQVWEAAYKAIVAAAPNAARKLAQTKVVGVERGVLTIGFLRQIDYDSVVEGPNAQKALDLIKGQLVKIDASVQTIRYVVAKDGSTAIEERAVELPAEGARLREMTEEVMNGTGTTDS